MTELVQTLQHTVHFSSPPSSSALSLTVMLMSVIEDLFCGSVLPIDVFYSARLGLTQGNVSVAFL